MTKTIYVTIAEFEEQGGVLQYARPIYNESHIQFKCDKWFWRHYTTEHKSTVFVQIQCTPIYK